MEDDAKKATRPEEHNGDLKAGENGHGEVKVEENGHHENTETSETTHKPNEET
jgi:hypothetical protein